MNLFVSNLPRELTEEELKEFFESCGTVTSAKIIMDRETNRPRGFGFVEMATKEEGEQAIEKLHETELKGRPLIVKEAIEREKRAPRSGGGGFRDNKRAPKAGGFNKKW